MQDYRAFFKDKRITVLGLGLLGRGVGDVALLAECGAELIVTDRKSEKDLATSLEKLSDFPNISYTLGEHRMEDFEGRDLVLVAAGVPLDSPYVARAREAGARVVQSAALFAELAEIPIIAVTGTRGKSTVTHMLHHMLTMATGEHVILGGNVRGVSNLQLLKEVKEDSVAVMELDSWQLQGFGWANLSPQVSVFTNFMEDHMNYYLPMSERNGGACSSTSERGRQESSAYHGAMDAYFADKANIFRYQHDGDTLVTTPEVFARAQAFGAREGFTFDQEVVLVDNTTLPEELLLRVPGQHNRLNAALAFEAGKAAGLTEDEVSEGLASFEGVEGRLQYLRDIGGVKVYNDNNATTPIATEMGIRAVAHRKNVVLIAGGAYKEVDPSPLAVPIGEHCKKVILLAGTGTDHLKDKIECEVVDSLRGAVSAAFTYAESGDVILFSPGFASFGMFVNEYDRNDQFVKCINEYESERD